MPGHPDTKGCCQPSLGVLGVAVHFLYSQRPGTFVGVASNVIMGHILKSRISAV